MSAVEKAEARRAKAEVEAILGDARVIAERAQLEIDLLFAEAAGSLVPERDDFADHPLVSAEERATVRDNPTALAALVEKKGAEARRIYAERFRVDTRGKAGWAARKIAEAKTAVEDAKELLRAAVRRAERVLGSREEILAPKLEDWAKAQKREPKKCDTCCGTGAHPRADELMAEAPCDDCGGSGRRLPRVVDRFPEDGVRVELRPKKVGGVEVSDTARALAAVLDRFGLLEALELGLVEQQSTLRESALVDYVAKHPDVSLDGVDVSPRTEVEKVTVVRLPS